MKYVESPCPECGSPGTLLYDGVRDYYFGFPGQWRFLVCTSSKCNIAWLYPPPDDSALRAAYSKYYTHDLRLGSKWKAGLRVRLFRFLGKEYIRRSTDALRRLPMFGRLIEDALLESGTIQPRRQGTILDIGCGRGDRLDLFSSVGWGRAIGVEPDFEAAKTGLALGRDIRVAAAESVPVDANTASAAMMYHVIEHVRKPKVALREALRILEPGIGKLVVITPNIESAMRHRWGRYWRGFEAPRHLTIFTVRALKTALLAAGFEIESARTSARSAAWIEAASAAASGIGSKQLSTRKRFATANRLFRQQADSIARGLPIGDEIVVIARKP